MTTTLVTGGAGFIGSHLVNALDAAGGAIAVLDNFSSGSRSNLAGVSKNVRIIEGDILDIDRLAAEIGPIDRIIHLAALISGYDSLNDPDGYVRTNITGTQRVIDFAAKAKVKRIVFASSSTIYGDRGGEPIREQSPPAPLSVYALTKLAGEHLLHLFQPIYGYSHCSLRLFNVYGPRQATDHPYANVTCKFSHAAANQLPVQLYGDGEQSRDFVYVSDVVDAFVNVLSGSRESIYNVGTGSGASINALLDILATISGQPLATARRPAWPNDIRSIRADVSRLASEFSKSPSTDLETGLHETVRYFAKEK